MKTLVLVCALVSLSSCGEEPDPEVTTSWLDGSCSLHTAPEVSSQTEEEIVDPQWSHCSVVYSTEGSGNLSLKVWGEHAGYDLLLSFDDPRSLPKEKELPLGESSGDKVLEMKMAGRPLQGTATVNNFIVEPHGNTPDSYSSLTMSVRAASDDGFTLEGTVGITARNSGESEDGSSVSSCGFDSSSCSSLSASCNNGSIGACYCAAACLCAAACNSCQEENSRKASSVRYSCSY